MRFQLEDCVWEITLACCFSCKYCGSTGGKKRENELSTEEAIDVARQLADLGCKRVNLIGGEVFMRQDWDVIVNELSSLDVGVTIISNGFLFTKEIINTLKALNIESVAISLDAPEEIHDKYRQTGSYKRAMSAIKTLVAHDINVSVISTLNSENVNYLDELYNTLHDLGIFAWQLQACSPMGNAARLGVNYAFDMKKVMEFTALHQATSPFAIGTADNIGYYPLGGDAGSSISAPHPVLDSCLFNGCHAGLTNIGIDSVGNVRGCESMYDDRFIEGNLREEALRTIWEDPNRFAYNRKFTPDKLTGDCKSCEMGPYCAGGCRSYNYFVHDKLYESPFCARNN